MFWLFLMLSSSLLGLSLLEKNTKLLLVQTLFRHGDRAPLTLLPNDPNNVTCCPEGLGELSVIGRQQQYAVGKYLRSRYKDFITSNPNEIYVNSSETARCLKSAEANVASFFAPDGMWKFEPGLNWQPIPVHYLPYSEDRYLSFPHCPKAGDEAMELYESDDVQSFFRSNRKSLDDLSQIVGVNVSNFLNIRVAYDTLYAEKVHNLTLPDGLDPYWDLLHKGSDIVSHVFYNSHELVRLRAGPLLQEIKSNMERKINGSLPHLKLQIYSSHDDNVGAMLLALTSKYHPEPPYCATIVFELHQMADGEGTVRMLYLNSTRPEIDIGKPHVLTLKGCSEFCPLKKFSTITQRLVPEDWDSECREMQPKVASKSITQEIHAAVMKQQVKRYYL